MNTMKDLKAEVLDRLQHLDGRYFESISTVSIEEMLGVIPVGETYHPDCVDGTLLDQRHEFWDEYVRSLDGERAIREECMVAIRLLKDEGKYRMIEPVDDELRGTTVRVESVSTVSTDFALELEETKGNAILRAQTDDGLYEVVMNRT